MNNKKLIIDTIFLSSLVTFFVIQLPVTIIFSYMIGFMYFLINGINSEIPRKYFNIYIFFSLLLFPAALTFNHGFTPLFYLMLSPFLVYMAYEFSVNSLDHIQGVLGNIYWLFVFFIVFQLMRHWGEPEPLGAILPWVSTNGIPSYLIVIQIAYSITYYLKNNRLPLFSSAVTLCISIFGLGRGSMVVSALIVLLSLFFNLYAIKSSCDRSFSLKFFLLIVIPFLVIFSDIVMLMNDEIQILIEGSKFASGILDEHRGRILVDYINKIDIMGLLFGQNYENTSINKYYGGNPHNSFIRMHSFYGLVGLLSLFLPVFLVLFAGKNQLQKWIIMSFVLLALLRAVSEPIFFPSTLDFFYFLYFFIFFRFAKKS